MGGPVRHARHLLSAAVRALGSRPQRTGPGRAGRSCEQPLLLLLRRDLAAGGLLLHRSPRDRGDDSVPVERGRRPCLVRISLSADGVDRSVPDHRALDRGRPPRASSARSRTVECGAHRALRAQAFPLADGGVVDRRRLGALFRRCAVAGSRPRDIPRAVRRLCLDRHSDADDLHARRPPARAGLPLHVPMAAHPGGAHRRACAQRHLSL